MSFKKTKKSAAITVVNNEKIHFFTLSRNGSWLTDPCTISLNRFLEEENYMSIFPETMKNQKNHLMIVPDFWFGVDVYEFRSKNMALSTAFLERKLKTKYPELSNVNDFFNFSHIKNNQGESELVAYFMEEPKVYQLYNRLKKCDFEPTAITTPAFLWEQTIRTSISDFENEGVSLIHLLPDECFLYFFSYGNYLFSRRIIFHGAEDVRENLKLLTYEINQSIYLFSQQSKAKMSKFYLFSSILESQEEISNILERKIEDLRPYLKLSITSVENLPEHIGPVIPFATIDYTILRNHKSISHRPSQKNREWKPIQRMNIYVGLILILILSFEMFSLWGITKSVPARERSRLNISEPPEEILQRYEEALDFFINKNNSVTAQETVEKISNILPDNIKIQNLDINLDSVSYVEFKGVVTANDTDNFINSLNMLLNGLKKNFKGAKSLDISQVDFKQENETSGLLIKKFIIELKFNILP